MIPLLILAAWWPIQTYWQSDDWIAIHYASNPLRALSDLAGNQYGLGGAVWFYRPLVTLSFALDFLVGGADPFVAHLSNAVAHGLGAMLVGMLVCRFLGAGAGWWAALVWGTSPVHAGSILWAVGRVDSHTVPWILLSALLLVRFCDGMQKTRLPALLAFIAALCSKELAIVMPGIAAVLCFALAAPGHRLRTALARSWPFFAVLAVYFGWRYMLFDRFIGGYAGWNLEPVGLALGLDVWTQRGINPLGLLTADGLAPLSLDASWLNWQWIGFLPAVAATAWLARSRPAVLLGLGVLYIGCAMPAVQFWTSTENPENLRYFTLPFAALAGLLAAGRAWTAIPALLVAFLPHLEVRRDYAATCAEARRIHDLLLEQDAKLDPGPIFVWGLPRQNHKHNVISYHLGFDRVVQPPFGDGHHRLFALRPLSPRADATRLPYGETNGLPHGHTVSLMRDTGAFVLAPDRRPRIGVHIEGPSHLTSEVLTDISLDRVAPTFVIDGPRSTHYRITVFTAGGYIACVLPNELPDGQAGGRVGLTAWLKTETTPQAYVVRDLEVPTALDLETRFPVLIEAGEAIDGGHGIEFAATRVARDLVWIQFDRGYAAFMSPR